MPLDRGMMDLVLGLSQLQEQRRGHDLQAMELNDRRKQYEASLKQWAHEHEDKDFAEALKDMSKLVPDQQAAYLKILRSKTGQQNPDFIKALQEFGIASPVGKGFGSMNSGQQQATSQEAASREVSGQSTGGVAMSGLQGALAGDALSTRTNPATGGLPTDQWMNLARNFAQQTGQGYTGEQFGLQQQSANANTLNAQTGARSAATGELQGQNDVERVRIERERLIQENRLKELMSKQPGALTPMEQGDMRVAMGNLLNAMKDPKSSRQDNQAREILYNELAQLVGSSAYIPQGSMGDPNGMFMRFMRSQGLLGAPETTGAVGINPLQNFFPSDSNGRRPPR